MPTLSPRSPFVLAFMLALMGALTVVSLPAKRAPPLDTSEQERAECLDSACPGDNAPRIQGGSQAVIKLNGQWVMGPRENFADGAGAIRITLRRGEPPVSVQLRSAYRPPGMPAWAQVKRALDEGKAERLEPPREDLEIVRLGQVVYFIAGQYRDADGLPLVAACHADAQRGSGASGFAWKRDIWASLQMTRQQCADWPRVYAEVARVLKLLQAVQG